MLKDQKIEKQKKLKIAWYVILAISLALPLFGGSCQRKGTDVLGSKEVSAPVDARGDDGNEFSDIEDKDDLTGIDQSKIPEGWKTYQSDRLNLSFAYPPNWYVLEDEGLGIFLSDEPLPEMLGPDIIGVPIVINKSDVNEQQIEIALREEDTSLIINNIEINNNIGKFYQYKGGPSANPTVSYRFFNGLQFVVVSADGNLSPSLLLNVLNTLSF